MSKFCTLSLCVEVDVDLDDYSPADVDRLNVLALEYGVAASSFSKLVWGGSELLQQVSLQFHSRDNGLSVSH